MELRTDLGRVPRGLAGLLALALAMCGGVAHAANMPTEVRASVTPMTIGYPERGSFEFRVELKAGPNGAQVGLEFQPLPWPGSSAGQPILLSLPALTGPGTIREADWPPPPPIPLPMGICGRGGYPTPYSFEADKRAWIELPPGANATATVAATVTGPPWPGTNYGVAISTFFEDDSDAERTPLAAVGPLFEGRSGVRMVMRTKLPPESRRARVTSPTTVGRTEPPLRHKPIWLRAVPAKDILGAHSWRAPGSVPLGKAMTDDRGHFELSPVPVDSPGVYVTLAHSPETRHLQTDWACGPRFTIAAPSEYRFEPSPGIGAH